eukprot:jgi/Botrbrau1/12707/Bobra.67_1s0070.1
MKLKLLNQYGIEAPKIAKHAFAFDTPRNEIKLHTLAGFIGTRGGGKSLAILNKIRHLKDQGFCDRMIILSPTYHSNKALFDLVPHKEEDVFIEPVRESLHKIIEIVEEEGEEWNRYLEELKQWKKQMKRRELHKHDVFNPLYEADPEKPTSKYGHKPVLHIVMDDLQGTPVFSMSPKSPLANMLLRHRHLGKGLGASVWLACQTFKSQGGLPRAIRQNLTLLALFKTRDEKALNDICDEVASDIQPETFLSAYRFATKEPHSFLLVDFSPKTEQHRFRKRAAQEQGEGYDPVQVAESLISKYREEQDETNSQHLPVDDQEDKLRGQQR